ncbi:hypothetical protein E6H22_07395 [Candidatus Bathyarchaeota archaeon]|nr:MAG: hypothetical protein E6H22_07395 [Candidatus Bathyarchaeota archaeon]
MKKILAISTLTIAALMLTPMSIGPVTSLLNFNYAPNLSYVQLGPLTTLPQGLPLCKNASLGNIVCYSPPFIKKAYGYPSTGVLDGTGQTIVIVDAFGSPTVESDLALFDSLFGIPAPRCTECSHGQSRQALMCNTHMQWPQGPTSSLT